MGIEMTRFDINQGTLGPGKGRMLTVARTANPRAGRIATVLIMKDPLQDKNFLASGMNVPIEHRVRAPFHERGVHTVKLMQGHDGKAGN